MLSYFYIFSILIIGLFIGTIMKLSIYKFNARFLIFLSLIAPPLVFLLHVKYLWKFLSKGEFIKGSKLFFLVISSYPIWVTVLGEIAAEIIAQKVVYASPKAKKNSEKKTLSLLSTGFNYSTLIFKITRALSDLIFKTYKNNISIHTF